MASPAPKNSKVVDFDPLQDPVSDGQSWPPSTDSLPEDVLDWQKARVRDGRREIANGEIASAEEVERVMTKYLRNA
jgi:hypothetical protein